MSFVWERDGDTYRATAADQSGTVAHHLVVEPLRDGSWTWTVWQAADPPRLARYGSAGTAQEGMKAAEQAAQ